MTHDGGKKKVEFALSKTTENSVRRVLLASVVTFVFPSQLWIKPHLRLESNNKPQTDARVLQQQRPWPFFSALPPHLPARLSVCQSLSSTSVTSLTPQHVRALCIVFVSFVPPLLALAAKLLINSSTSSIFTAQRQRVRRRWRWSQEG